MDVSLSELREMVMDREAWRAEIHVVAKSRTLLSDWTELSTVILLQELQKRGIDEMFSYTFFDIYLDFIKYFVSFCFNIIHWSFLYKPFPVF